VKALINRVLFEIETNIPSEKIDFFEVLRVVFYNKLIKILEDYFASFPEDTNMSIDRLEIDLDDFLIEWNDVDSFILKFTERFKAKLIAKGMSVRYFREAQLLNPIEIIKEFLMKGYTSKRFFLDNNDISTFFLSLNENQKKELTQFIYENSHNLTLRKRFFNEFSKSSIEYYFESIIPNYKKINQGLTSFYKDSSPFNLFNISISEFRVLIHSELAIMYRNNEHLNTENIVAYLFNKHPHIFSQKNLSHFPKLARHYQNDEFKENYFNSTSIETIQYKHEEIVRFFAKTGSIGFKYGPISKRDFVEIIKKLIESNPSVLKQICEEDEHNFLRPVLLELPLQDVRDFILKFWGSRTYYIKLKNELERLYKDDVIYVLAEIEKIVLESIIYDSYKFGDLTNDNISKWIATTSKVFFSDETGELESKKEIFDTDKKMSLLYLENMIFHLLRFNKFPWWGNQFIDTHNIEGNTSRKNIKKFLVLLLNDLRLLYPTSFKKFIRNHRNLFENDGFIFSDLDFGFVQFVFKYINPVSYIDNLSTLIYLIPNYIQRHSSSLFINESISLAVFKESYIQSQSIKGMTQDVFYALLIKHYAQGERNQLDFFTRLFSDSDAIAKAIGIPRKQIERISEICLDRLDLGEVETNVTINQTDLVESLFRFIEQGFVGLEGFIDFVSLNQFINTIDTPSNELRELLTEIQNHESFSFLIARLEKKEFNQTKLKQVISELGIDLKSLPIDKLTDLYIEKILLSWKKNKKSKYKDAIEQVLNDIKSSVDVKRNIINPLLFKTKVMLYRRFIESGISKELIDPDSFFKLDQLSEDIQNRIRSKAIETKKSLEKILSDSVKSQKYIELLDNIDSSDSSLTSKSIAEIIGSTEMERVHLKKIDVFFEEHKSHLTQDHQKKDLIKALNSEIFNCEDKIISNKLLIYKENIHVLFENIKYFIQKFEIPWWSVYESEIELQEYYSKLYQRFPFEFKEFLQSVLEEPELLNRMTSFLDYSNSNWNEPLDLGEKRVSKIINTLFTFDSNGQVSAHYDWLYRNLLSIYSLGITFRELIGINNMTLLYTLQNRFDSDVQRLKDFVYQRENDITDDVWISDLLSPSIQYIFNIYEPLNYENKIQTGELIQHHIKELSVIVTESKSETKYYINKAVEVFAQPHDLLDALGLSMFDYSLFVSSKIISAENDIDHKDFLFKVLRKSSLISRESLESVKNLCQMSTLNELESKFGLVLLEIEIIILSYRKPFYSEQFNRINFHNLSNSIKAQDSLLLGFYLLHLMVSGRITDDGSKTYYQVLEEFNVFFNEKKRKVFSNFTSQLNEVLNSIEGDSDNPYIDFFHSQELKSNVDISFDDLVDKTHKAFLEDTESFYKFKEFKSNITFNENLLFNELNSLEPEFIKLSDEEKIYVPNAGVIILWPFLSRLFKNLNWIEKGKFKNRRNQEKAIKIVQFLIDEEDNPPEIILILNKVICGIEINEPLNKRIRLTKKEKSEAVYFLESIISQWEEMKNTSRTIFQDTFLKREGILYKKEDKWHLKVEHRAIDILLKKLPWGLSIVKFPWNNYLIIVEWEATN